MTLKEKIKDYVNDHYKYYAFYPYDVEVDGKLYSYDEYMAIIHSEVIIYCLLYQVKIQHLQIKLSNLWPTYILT